MRVRLGALGLLAASCACVVVAAGAGAGAAGCRGKPATDDEPATASGSGSGSGSTAVPRPPVPDQISGTLTLDGKPLAISKCRPGRDVSIYVDLVTAAGVLRFVPYVPEMRWNPRPESAEPGVAVACRLQRSWGGGSRPDRTTYFRGQLIFSCKTATGTLDGDVTLDCGNISPLERKLLDEGRQQKLEELKLEGETGSSGSSGSAGSSKPAGSSGPAGSAGSAGSG
jgi:hypothetical protein